MTALQKKFRFLALGRRFSAAYNNDVGTEFHFTPLDDNDPGPRTMLTRLTDEINRIRQVGIQSISKYGFRLCDGTFLYGPIAIFPKAALSWRVHTPDDINEHSVRFFTMLEPKLDVLVVGAGDQSDIDSVRRRIAPYLSKHRIGLEILNSRDAAMTFNLLNIEYRCVAAALYPPNDLEVTAYDHHRLMSQISDPIHLDEHFMAAGVKDRFSETAQTMRKWLRTDEEEKLENILGEQKNEIKLLGKDKKEEEIDKR